MTPHTVESVMELVGHLQAASSSSALYLYEGQIKHAIESLIAERDQAKQSNDQLLRDTKWLSQSRDQLLEENAELKKAE